MRVTGRSPNRGHPANRHSGRVPFKASRPERKQGRGEEPDSSLQCLLGGVVCARRTQPQTAQRELQVRDCRARPPAATPLGWAPGLRPSRKAALAARGGEAAERGQEVGAARLGTRGSGIAGEGARVHPTPVLPSETTQPTIASPFLCDRDSNFCGCRGRGAYRGEGAELMEGA